MDDTATKSGSPTDLAARSPLAEIREQNRRLARAGFVRQLLDSLRGPAAVLNETRQLVAANAEFGRFLRDCDAAPEPLGRRPGEIFHCLHAEATPDGCGTAPECQHCGALKAILAAVAGGGCRRDCVIMRAPELGDLRLTLRTRPLEIHGERLIILTVD